MATSSKSMPVMGSDPLEQKGENIPESNANMLQCPLSQQHRSSLDGPVAIFWDIENCPVPSDVPPEDVAGNIRMALRVNKEAGMMFSAYGDFSAFPRRVREGCQRTGVKLIDVPNGRKDAADKAIVVDMFFFALDNRPPSSIMLISGDVVFAPTLHILGQRGYTVILVIPAGVGVSPALCNACNFVSDWPSMARGKGFVSPSKTAVLPCGGSIELAESSKGSHINDDSEGHIWVQRGDLHGLKGELVKLLELSGGCLPLAQVPAEYQNLYGKPLYAEQGTKKLVNLIRNMGDTIAVGKQGNSKSVYLESWKAGPNAPPPSL